jgi:transcriptional regulator with XRE-family HTH domain
MSNLRKRLGKIVHRLRKARGFSQERFADKIGVHRTFIGSIERGEQNLSLSSLEKVAGGLGISLSSLFEEIEKER